VDRKESLSRLEEIVLLAVMRLGPASYGVSIRREIKAQAGRDVSLGAIYPTLDRLEEQGLVRSHRGEPTAERGGRSRRHFSLLPKGHEALRQSRRAIAAMWEGFEPEGEVKQ